MNVTIIGGGYVGLVTGACLSTLNHHVTIVEIFPEKVAAINSAVPPKHTWSIWLSVCGVAMLVGLLYVGYLVKKERVVIGYVGL